MRNARISRAQAENISLLVHILLDAARQRCQLEPQLWPIHAEAEQRIRALLEREFLRPETFAWFVAERAGEVVGVVKSGRYPAPPVYAELLAGLTGDDFFATEREMLPALLDASEQFQLEGGVSVVNAACPAQDAVKLQLLQAHGYDPLALWMTCSVINTVEKPAHIRPATLADIPALVRLNAEAQEGKQQANSRFWTPHPEAQARFAGWMQHSLTLADRDVLVSEKNGLVNGFVIVQPTTLPPAHDSGFVATLDDLAADDWRTVQELIQAAHATAASRDYRILQAICSVNWPERVQVLQDSGFRTANLWLMKD